MNNAITLQNNSRKSLASPKKPSASGVSKVKSKPPPQKAATEDIVFKPSLIHPLSGTSYTQESHQPNNTTTCKDRLPCCNLNIQNMKLSVTSAQVSTLKEKDCKPFWNSRLEDVYKQLWLPTETGSPGLLSNSSISSSSTTMSNWKCCQVMTPQNQSTNCPKTSLLSLQFLLPDTMVPENIAFSRKLRIYPNKEQKILFQKCLGAYRYFYNKTNSFIKESLSKKESLVLKREYLRSRIMKNDADIPDDGQETWQKEVPYDVRQEAINDCIVAWKTNFTKQKKGLISQFSISFKTKKHSSQMFRVNKKTLNIQSMTIFPRRLGKKAKLRFRKRDISKYFQDGTLDGNFLIVKTRPDYWYLCLPRTKKLPVYNEPFYKSVFLDPGVRSFQTFYSPEGVCGHISADKKLQYLAQHHDHLQSVASKCISKTKRHLRQRMAKIRHTMKNIINDLHWKTCSLLCNNFQTIVMPPFKVKEMTKGSPLGNRITRAILSLSHGKFQERMKYFVTSKRRNLIISSEAYTTKTCGNCGNIQDMFGNKTYNCGHCKMSLDRDTNGARNLCLRTLTLLQ